MVTTINIPWMWNTDGVSCDREVATKHLFLSNLQKMIDSQIILKCLRN